MPYLYGRNNQHGLNGVSRALHNRYLEGAFNTQFRLPQLRRRLEDHRRPFDTLRTGIEDPPVIVKILSHLDLPSRAPPRAPARRVDLVQTI
jgi:hypothetical protein